MCGIAGGLRMSNSSNMIDWKVIDRINIAQHRRGPDGVGVWRAEDGGVVLGHRRLAIIDVRDSGAQPMRDATGRWVVTFNGEIYNYRELRSELEGAGRRFATDSDTEVLINCVAEWGEAGLRKLRGMFAFGLWDNESRELWLARDPFGIKPLYWSQTGTTIWFASQARALATCAPVDASRDPAGLVAFYLWGAIPDPFTWWEGVHSLPAGCFLRITPDDATPAPKAFAEIESAFTASPAAALTQGELKELLVDSVRSHYVADVPVGVFLSAGIDSTVIATLAKEAGCELRTVTLAFDEFKGTPADEAPLAEETARLLGAAHTTLRIGRDEFLGLVDDFMETMDQPTTDGLNSYLVSRAAHAVGLKVALSGLGGDELFGGYDSFSRIPRLVALANKVPGRAALGKIIQAIGTPIQRTLGTNPKYLALLKYSNDFRSAHFLRRCLHLVEEIDMLVDESWSRPGRERLAALLPDAAADHAAASDPLTPYARISSLELHQYMRYQPLRDTDWASMAHSIEVRLPFLDIPTFSRLAPAIASDRPPSKADLANCAGDIGGRLVARRKTGFGTPVAEWLDRPRQTKVGLRPWADTVAANFRTRAQLSA